MKDKRKLAIVVSHPIQYYSPLFKVLAQEINLKVFYCFNPNPEQQGKDGFGKAFMWDVNLFDGYEHEFLENISILPSSSLRSGCNTPRIGDSLEQFGATHVVTFGWHLKSYQQTLAYCKRKKIPIAVRGDSIFDPSQSKLKKIIKSVYFPFFLRQYSAFLSVGQRNKEYLLHYNVPEKKIIFSPHAVDQAFWGGERSSAKDYTFVWVAKFIPLKRVKDVIGAFLKLNKEFPDTCLKLIGAGQCEKAAKRQANGNPKIEFLGFKNQKDLRKEYLSSDCLVLSSNSETWGLVVNEGFAAGIPAIVSSACGCVPDLITSNTGRVFQHSDESDLLVMMKEMLHSKSIDFLEGIKEKNIEYSFNRNVKSFNEFLNYH